MLGGSHETAFASWDELFAIWDDCCRPITPPACSRDIRRDDVASSRPIVRLAAFVVTSLPMMGPGFQRCGLKAGAAALSN